MFADKYLADEWILRNKLSGVLTAYPLNEGCFEWVAANNLTSLKPETLNKKRSDPDFIASFSTASQENYHCEGGVQVSR